MVLISAWVVLTAAVAIALKIVGFAIPACFAVVLGVLLVALLQTAGRATTTGSLMLLSDADTSLC